MKTAITHRSNTVQGEFSKIHTHKFLKTMNI